MSRIQQYSFVAIRAIRVFFRVIRVIFAAAPEGPLNRLACCRLPVLPAVSLAVLLWAAPSAMAQGGSDISRTRHNLTGSGPGPVRVAGATDVCKFCHTPHASNPIAPLWNRNDPGTYYQTYRSSTLVAQVGQPNGSSRLCLSCHDGTIALAQTYNPRNAPRGSLTLTPHDKGYIGTDLSDDHPISFVYDASLAARKPGLRPPSSLPKELVLDENKQLQCTTCHDAHDDRFGNFLKMSNAQSRLCQSCHAPEEWTQSVHAASSASLAGSRMDRWDNLRAGTVRDAACEACHRPHTAGGRERLLRHQAEEDNCLTCHDGSVAPKDIKSQLAKVSVHPVTLTTGVHDPTESPRSMPKHVECVDCHNAHRVMKSATERAPFIKASMTGATGISAAGGSVAEAVYEYQVCYKCHAGTGTVRDPLVDRVRINTDASDEFNPANAGYHPVQAQGKNSNVPSLLQPLTTSSMIYCTDCHGSDSSQVKGPHGSAFRPMLRLNYVVTDLTGESPAAYALCYSCHNRASILGNRSFSEHKKHVVDSRAPCSACHDPHGVSISQAGAGGGTHLINFDRRIVTPSKAAGTGPTFTDSGVFKGSCTLNCHGKEHNAQKYPD